MDALARQLDALPGPAAEPMLDNLCRLVAITAGAAAPRAVEGGREAVRAARLSGRGATSSGTWPSLA